MKRILMKLVTVVLAITIVTSTVVFADSQEVGLWEKNLNTADIFNVHVTPGEAHNGYMFRLVDEADVSIADNENIQVILAV